MRIALFVEDAGHLLFIRNLVERIAWQEGVEAEILERNTAGGKGATVSSLRRYLRDVGISEPFSEIVVIAIDGNCASWRERIRQLSGLVARSGYAGRTVCAVPDPHVEVWYLSDGRAAACVAGAARQNALPAYKCAPNVYKDLLRSVFLDGGIDPPGGGSEFGQEIAQALDIRRARRSQETLDEFLSDLEGAMREARAGGKVEGGAA